MQLDLEARLMGETLVLNRSLDPLFRDYIELNDLNEPLELRRNQDISLMHTIKECEVVDAPKDNFVDYRNDEHDTRIDDYPSYCDYDKKPYIDYAHNLKFSCMIGSEFVHVNFFPILYVNVIYKKFHNSIINKLEYNGNNVVGALMNVPIFVGTFSVIMDFAILEEMDAYRNEGMGDVIVGELFLREIRIKVRRFEGMITFLRIVEKLMYPVSTGQSDKPFKDMMSAVRILQGYQDAMNSWKIVFWYLVSMRAMFLIKMFPRRSEDGDSEYPFFKVDGSSSDEWRDYVVTNDDYEGPLVFDDDQYEEELMPVYDTAIEDVIEEEEGFVRKG
nr:hypothetical protein [Tanacetum cinerariifolium]GEV29869.1 hypothetical protein [Tanacetum cinerariifolium]